MQVHAPTDLDTPAETDEEIFAECAERLRIAEQAESQNRAHALQDLEFGEGNQWPADIFRDQPGRVKLTINLTNALVRRVVNNMKQQRPRIKVHPVADGSQVQDAKVVNGLIRHIEALSNASVAYDTAGESAVRMGWGYFRITGDYVDPQSFEQELKIIPIRNTFTGYIDPAAILPDGSDMDWFIISSKMKRQEFLRLYPDEDKSEWSYGGAGDSIIEWQTKEEIRLAEYYRIKYAKDTLYKLSDGRAILKSAFNREAFGLAGITIIDKRSTARRQVQWFRVSGTTIVERRDLPGQWIPVLRVEGNALDVNGEVRRKGMIRDLSDANRQYNYWASAKTEKLALASKAPWIAAEEQLDGRPEWEDANQRAYSVLKYKILKDAAGQPINVPPPQRMPAVEVDQGFVEAGQSAQKDLLAVAGMPHEPGQDKAGEVISGVALRRRQAISDISHFQYYDNQTLAIAQCGRILLDYAPFYYGEPGRLQRIIGEDGQPEMVTLNDPQPPVAPEYTAVIKNNMTVGRYDVVMDTGPGYDTKREEGAEAMMALLSIKPLAEQVMKVGADLVVRGIDAPYMDELANRLSTTNPEGMDKAVKALPKEAQAIVASLQNQLQQAQAKIQQQALEIKYKLQVEQGWQQTELRKAQMQGHVKAHDTDTRAQASVDVAEIQQAGQLLNSHVEAAHNQAAAKELIQAGTNAEMSNGIPKD